MKLGSPAPGVHRYSVTGAENIRSLNSIMERTKADAVQAARELLSGVEESLRLSLSRNPLRRRVTSGPGPAPLGRPRARFFFRAKDQAREPNRAL